MKYLKKIFENWNKKDDPVYNDILNSLVYINDKFGEPSIYPTKYGSSNVCPTSTSPGILSKGTLTTKSSLTKP